mmetsp:Transcript_12645/g.20532  ORF Transcript_12645/g.20532 Transcript_12645/m.20532 type:complete len:836 (-) Transcript_12645:1414-3921(-)|eukprot:CAMPEP_0114423318 /NCGR_PEP_ID=MMETSP0103-20121206/6085_1 /TAXON_ID=37642 ORGANISM="Paraphysomonas imperforata, Strain PA2" /NCGR_SAMPLE_ID=MMETSP0103 /ASSEMBLY_ACC=CAM_ASM_000201 /LENGTH=835 /DNA_ID=CAMNT_0001591973 /DNA_START=134 /DNA_END=2641 /DNA_ORIENTATION=-
MEKEKMLSTPCAASGWLWENIWRSDTPQAALNIVDVVKLRNDEVVEWLFTASDGTVKRKSLLKLTSQRVEAKCRDSDGNLRAHLLSPGEWSLFPDLHAFRIPTTVQFILPMTQILDSFLYVEQEFEKKQGIALPKMCTYRLVASDVKGKCSAVPDPQIIPTNKIASKNKTLNDTMRDKMNKMISLLEQRSKCNILKMVCVFIVEDTRERTLNIRLHHCKEVNMKASSTRKHKKLMKKEYSDTHSIISEITNASRGSCRTFKCSGDFCSFSEADESSLAEMEEELNFRFDVEAAKARRRHRNVDGGIEAEFEDDVEANVKFQRELIASAVASNALTDHTATTQSYKVPQKSVLLARSEMKLLDSCDSYMPNVTAWSKTLQAWYRRTGRALVGHRVTAIPASSAHHIEHAMLQIAEHGSVVDDSHLNNKVLSVGDTSQSPKLTKEALESLKFGRSNVPEGKSDTVQYDLQSNPFHNGQSSSAKHLGRYYSNTSVCEKCYHVYKDLDRLRQFGFKQNLQDKKLVALKAKEGVQSYEDIEKLNRFTNQTLHNMRMAEAKVRLDPEKRPQLPYGENNSFLSKEGAPKGILPPLPWQLSKAEVAAEYQQQGGSTFVRNIGAKAREMSLIAEQGSVYAQQNLQDGDALDPKYDWRQNLAMNSHGLVKSASAGDMVRRPTRKNKKESNKYNTRGFNSDRLLHPHQRHLASMKREQQEGGQKSDTGVRVKGGAKRKMLSKLNRTAEVLPPLAQMGNGDGASFGYPSQPRSPSPITYSYVKNKLNCQSPPNLHSVKGSSKSVTFSASNSVHNIPHRSESVFEDSDGDDDDDEIGWSPFMIAEGHN